MLDLPENELSAVEDDVSYDNTPIWISLLVPNPELTEQYLGDYNAAEDTPDDMPNLMLHDWFYVVVDPSQFDDHGLFYTEDEPFRMSYEENEYDIDSLARANRRLIFQDVVPLDGSLDGTLRSWLQDACSDIGVDSDAVCEELEDGLVADTESRGDHAIVMATRFEQSLPP